MKPVFSENNICSEEQINDAIKSKNKIRNIYSLIVFSISVILNFYWFGHILKDSIGLFFLISVLLGIVAAIGFTIIWIIADASLTPRMIGATVENSNLKLVDASIMFKQNFCKHLKEYSEEYDEVKDYIQRVLLVRQVLLGDYNICENIAYNVEQKRTKEQEEYEYRESCKELHLLD